MVSEAYRLSKDSLGEVRVPQTAYYGAQTQRAVENFPISGLRLPRRFIRAQGLIKWAAAKVHKQLVELPGKKADAIIQAADEVIEGRWDSQFVVDVYQAGAGTSQNMNANEVIANRAVEILGGEPGDMAVVHPNDDVNKAQSTNDTIHVAINIASAEAIVHDLLPVVTDLERALLDKAKQFHDVFKSGRTHLQDAVPMRLGHEFAGYAATIEQVRRQLETDVHLLYAIGLGGNAVGTGINANPKYPELAIALIAQRTGLPFTPPANRFAFMQNTSAAIHMQGVLKQLAIHLIKISSDIRLLSSGPRTGLAELRLPAIQPGSSIMPGKVNPVMAEMMYMIASQVIGHDTTVMTAGIGSQLEINVMMPVIAYDLLHSIQILANGIRQFTARCVEGIEVDEAQCRKWLEQSTSLATALNPVIGYDKAAVVAKQAFREGKTVREWVKAQGMMTEDELDRWLDVGKMVGD